MSTPTKPDRSRTRLQQGMAWLADGTWTLRQTPDRDRYYNALRAAGLWSAFALDDASQHRKATTPPMEGTTPFGAPDWITCPAVADMTPKQRETLLNKHLARWRSHDALGPDEYDSGGGT